MFAAICGPCEVKPQKMLIDKATVDVIYKRKSGLPSIDDRLKESMLLNVFKSAILSTEHPRTLISITTQEMQATGSLLSASVNAGCLALMDFGIPMKYYATDVTCIIDTKIKLIVDPDKKQMEDCKAVFTIVFGSVIKNVVGSKIEGEFTKEEFEEVMEACSQASSLIFQFYRVVVCKETQTIVPR